jgi:hypothetical protein
MTLTAELVEEVFRDCLADDKDSHTTVKVEGVVHTAAFDRAELAKHHYLIGEMLGDLPLEFQPRANGGQDGWSFLQACNDKNGEQWTGLHMTIEQLLLLGIATGQAHFCLPKNVWPALPGGMPYFVVDPIGPKL